MGHLPKNSKKAIRLDAVAQDILTDKTLPLYAYRAKNKYLPVPGEGSPDAAVIFVGEAPGLNEARTGRPFIGAAGRVLNELLASIGLAREAVFITSIVKDRPPENRDPLPKEIKTYTPFLMRQIDIIKPRVIAALGRHAMNFLMDEFGLGDQIEPISRAHGKPVSVQSSWGSLTILPLYHPAAALYNGSLKATLIKDFKTLKTYI